MMALLHSSVFQQTGIPESEIKITYVSHDDKVIQTGRELQVFGLRV